VSGQRAPRSNIRAVAEHAGVAMSTVSRALNGHVDVSPAMRERIDSAARELGYRPNILAQGLRTRRTRSVGITVSDLSDPALAAAVAGAERQLRRAGYSVLLTSSERAAELDRENIRLLMQRSVDGFILGLSDAQHPALADLLREAEVPIVLLDHDVPAGLAVSRVVFDHHAGMTRAARHLLALGHREIALIVGGRARPARERRLAVTSAVDEAGGGCHCVVYDGSFSVAHGERSAGRILDRTPQASAIIAGGTLLLRGALRAIRARGLRLGVDVSLVGCDDVLVADLHTPPIALVYPDMRSIGLAAADLLLEQMLTPAACRQISLPTRFSRRPSCGPPGSR
jgi:LacI family transcriptional regulator